MLLDDVILANSGLLDLGLPNILRESPETKVKPLIHM